VCSRCPRRRLKTGLSTACSNDAVVSAAGAISKANQRVNAASAVVVRRPRIGVPLHDLHRHVPTQTHALSQEDEDTNLSIQRGPWIGLSRHYYDKQSEINTEISTLQRIREKLRDSSLEPCTSGLNHHRAMRPNRRESKPSG